MRKGREQAGCHVEGEEKRMELAVGTPEQKRKPAWFLGVPGLTGAMVHLSPREASICPSIAVSPGKRAFSRYYHSTRESPKCPVFPTSKITQSYFL